MFRWLLIIALLIAAVVGLVIGVLNAESATLDLAVGELTLPLGALVLSALGAGLLAGLALAWVLFIVPGRFRKRRNRSGGHRQGTDLADRQHG